MASLTEHDLPSDSDDSDVDFKLSDEESLPSEEESDGSVEETALGEEQTKDKITNGKRKKKQTKSRKKIKKKWEDSGNEETCETKKLSEEEEKKKADSLWSDFMKDCSPPVRKASAETEVNSENKRLVTEKPVETKPVVLQKENKAVITEIFEFAGEQIKVEKEVPVDTLKRGRGGLAAGRGGLTAGRGRGGVGGAGGLASLVGQLGKKNKLSTLEKSKLDWDRFKKDEGIADDLQTHNKGKEGYLERQDFLQRADLRQFEIEKELRTTRRSNR